MQADLRRGPKCATKMQLPKVAVNLKLAAAANKRFQAGFVAAKGRISWASRSKKPGMLDAHLQAHYNKLMLELHAEQVQNASEQFEKAASSFQEKCDGLQF